MTGRTNRTQPETSLGPIAVPYSERRRVAWADTDAGGRIHFTAVFRYAEEAETALRRGLGLLDDWAEYPRRHVEAEYLAVLRFEDEVEVCFAPTNVGRTSITWGWEIMREGELCVRGRHTVVHVDSDGRAASLPAPLREALAHAQQSSPYSAGS